MAKVYIFLADEVEEVEALTSVDLLRRAGNAVTTVSITGNTTIHGSHGINLAADGLFENIDFSDGDLFVLPGGPGHTAMKKFAPLKKLFEDKDQQEKHLAAICASPSILAGFGFLKGKKAVVYPGMEGMLEGADVQDIPVVTDGNITTGHGPGASFDFALELIRVVNGSGKEAQIRREIVWQH